MVFNESELAAILRLAYAIAMVDGKVEQEEVSAINDPFVYSRFPGREFNRLLDAAGDQDFAEATTLLSEMDDTKKKFATAYLGTVIASDGHIDDKEVAMWNLISIICNLPKMTIEEAMDIMDTMPNISCEEQSPEPYLNFVFNSREHTRYENGVQVIGDQGKVKRVVRVEPNVEGCNGYNIKGGDGYIVTIYSEGGAGSLFGGNVQMSPKPMRIISHSNDKIILRGYPTEAMSPFGWVDFPGQDYGLTIYVREARVCKCILHMHDRNVDIEYI